MTSKGLPSSFGGRFTLFIRSQILRAWHAWHVPEYSKGRGWL